MDIGCIRSYIIGHRYWATLRPPGVQAWPPTLNVELRVINKCRWGHHFFADESIRVIAPFPELPSFTTSDSLFSYSSNNVRATALLAQTIRENLQACGHSPAFTSEFATDLSEIFDSYVNEVEGEEYKELNIFVCVEVDCLFFYRDDDYVEEGGTTQFSEVQFRPRPASEKAAEKAAEALAKAVVVGEEDSCTVCIERFVKGEDVTCLPCKHVFHSACIVAWLKNMDNCPNCRRNI